MIKLYYIMRHSLIIILLHICYCLYAQVKISSTQLIGTKWSVPSVPGAQSCIRFYSDYFIHTRDVEYTVNNRERESFWSNNNVEHKKRHRENKYYYYLSPKEPTCFNQKKKKKKTLGGYLAYYCAEAKKIEYYTIISFSEKEMILFKKAPKQKEGEIAIGGPLEDITLILTRMEE